MDASPSWAARLHERLERQRSGGLLRAATADSATPGDAPVNLSTNDYLRLRQHPRLIEAAQLGAQSWGVGAGASRLAGGTLALHDAVEQRFADFKGAQSATLLPTGFMAGLAVLNALPAPGDLLLLDKRCHACLIDAARLASSRSASRLVELRTFAHNDAQAARRIALRHLARQPDACVWLVAESVYSMDGDLAPVAELAALRDELSRASSGGACLILDEAHATGVLGPDGAGLAAAHPGAGDVCISTASKALGAQGGVVSGPDVVKQALDNFARAHIYTTAIAPPIAGAILEALDVVRDEPWRRDRLRDVAQRVRAGLRERGWPVAPDDEQPTPIIPLITGEADAALALSQRLRERGIIAPAIRPPTVPTGSARVRLALHCELSDADVERALEAVGACSAAEMSSSA